MTSQDSLGPEVATPPPFVSAFPDAAPVDAHAGIPQNGQEASPEAIAAQIRDVVTEGFGGEAPDALFTLAGGIIPSPNRADGWRTFAWSHKSEHGISTGCRTRIVATAEIAKSMPGFPIVTDSYNRFDPDEPTMASVAKKELIQRGVDPDRILLEEVSFSTITELTEMVKMAQEMGWKKVSVLSNEYHLPRISEMYARLTEIVDDEDFQKTLQAFKEQGGQVRFVGAEPVMRIASPWYGRYLDAVEKSPQYAETIEGEAKGLSDLQAGKYRVRLTPEKPRNNN